MSEERRLVFTFSLADFGVKLELATIFVFRKCYFQGYYCLISVTYSFTEAV